MDNLSGIITTQQQSGITLAGQAANLAATRHVFEDYRSRRSANTLHRQAGDLMLFARYLAAFNAVPTTDLSTDPDAWRGITWGLVAGFARWQLQSGYAVSSINVRLSTVKKYAALAFQAGSIDTNEHALIRMVQGYRHKEGKQIDEKRTEVGLHTRIQRKGAKKAVPVSIPDDIAEYLKTPANDTPQARRDALLMCLMLDHGRGMTDDQIKRIGAYTQFERKLYEQQGLGLGLILAKRLVELYSGELTIVSELGKGTTVSIELLVAL